MLLPDKPSLIETEKQQQKIRMKEDYVGNAKCIISSNQVIVRDVPACKMMKEEGTLGNCHCPGVACYMLCTLNLLNCREK